MKKIKKVKKDVRVLRTEAASVRWHDSTDIRKHCVACLEAGTVRCMRSCCWFRTAAPEREWNTTVEAPDEASQAMPGNVESCLQGQQEAVLESSARLAEKLTDQSV